MAPSSSFLNGLFRFLSAEIAFIRESYESFFATAECGRHLIALEEKLERLTNLLNDGEGTSVGESRSSVSMEHVREVLHAVSHLVPLIDEGAEAIDFNNLTGMKLLLSRLWVILTDALRLGMARYVYPVARPETVYGREQDVKLLIESLLVSDDHDHSFCTNFALIAVVGAGGLGKTTLAQVVFQDDRVKGHFDLCCWVCVSDGLDVGTVARELLEGITTTAGCHSDWNDESLVGRVTSLLCDQKVLIVLDGLLTDENWGKLVAMVFAFLAQGSKVLVTTGDLDAAKSLSPSQLFMLEPLGFDHSWALFKERAFLDDVDAGMDSYFETTGREITRKCGGNPLAIRTIASTLLGAPKEQWENILHNNIWQSENKGEGDCLAIFPALRLSYDNLPSHLKICFMYLSLFHSSYQLGKPKLVRMWMAEGIVDAEEGKSLEDIGSEYFDELARKSFIQNNCKVHDIVRDLADLISGEFFYRMPTNTHSCKLAGCIHHASVHTRYNVDEADPLGPFQGLQNLQTLIVNDFSHAIDSIAIPPCWNSLRVLDVSDTNIIELPPTIGTLKQLRYLKTSRNGRLQKLPDELCSLYNLQSLECDGCWSLEILPRDIGDLQNLWFLSFSGAAISCLPNSVSKLTNLMTLDFLLCKRLANIPQDMGVFQSLRKLYLQQVPIASLSESIGQLSSLLELDLGSTSLSSLPDSICKLQKLQSLGLRYCRKLSCLPESIGQLSSLLELDLESTLLSSLPNSICKLQKLQSLSLRYCRKLTCLPEDVGNLQNLRIFDLHSTSISTMPHSICQLYRLEVLDLEFCENLTHLSTIGFQVHDQYRFQSSSCKIIDDEVTHALHPSDSAPSISYVGYAGDGLSKTGSYCLDVKVKACFRLKKIELPFGPLPLYTRLVIQDCPYLESLQIHEDVGERICMSELVIDDCPCIKALPKASLSVQTSLRITRCDQLQLSLYHLLDDMLFLDSLKQLDIDCKDFHLTFSRLELVRNQLLDWLPIKLGEFTSLHVIKLFQCPLLQGISNGALPISIRKLKIVECPRLLSLPISMHRLSSLTSIIIHDCPRLEILPYFAIPSSLVKLQITACDNLRYFFRGLHEATSLRVLRIGNCPKIQSVSEDELPISLVEVSLHFCDNLEFVANGFDRLTSLQVLELAGCQKLAAPLANHLLGFTVLEDLRIDWSPQLEPMLSKGLPASLKTLKVRGFGESSTSPQQGWLLSLSSLQRLKMVDFSQEIQFLKDGRLPSSLLELSLCGLSSLKQLPECLLSCTSLKKLTLSNCPHLDLSLGDRLPPFLSGLKIQSVNSNYLPKLDMLVYLKVVSIRFCPFLELRSTDRFPNGLVHLRVVDCDKLATQMQDGGFWKTERMPFITFYSTRAA